MTDQIERKKAKTALILGGGGARAAYQAGAVHFIADAFPEASFDVLSGVSAGAINIAYLANHIGSTVDAANGLVKCWHDISSDQVFASQSALSLYHRILGTLPGSRRFANAINHLGEGGSLLDTGPLRAFLSDRLGSGRMLGVTENVNGGRLAAVCITTTSYSTGQTVSWVQGGDAKAWDDPNHIGMQADLTLNHVMASTALPVLFPAVQISEAWYGDGGIRLTTPLAPAIHMEATNLLAISTRFGRSREEANIPSVDGPPPLAQIIGVLLNAIFLDALEQDAATLQKINKLVRAKAEGAKLEYRSIRLLLLRPSADLAKMAADFEFKSRGALKLLTSGLGTGQTKSPDWLSMLLFDNDYVRLLMQLGWDDAARQRTDIEAFLEGAE